MKCRFNMLFGSVACLALLFGSTLGVAHGALLSSSTLLQMEQRAQNIHAIEQALTREAVSRQLEAMGVDSGELMQRLAQLTDEELMLMEARIKDLPAGAGLLEVVGIVFVVLLILELVGVTDIFKAI